MTRTLSHLLNPGLLVLSFLVVAGEARAQASLPADAGVHALIPIGPVRDLIADLERRGRDARLTELDGITHFESPRYAEDLRVTIVPWLREVLGRR